jgi:hypothetical protein
MTESRRPQVGPQDAFALEADLLRHALRGEVVKVRDQLEPFELEIFERVPAQEPKGACGHATSSGLARAPIADVARARIVHAHSDRSDDAAAFGDCELLPTDSRHFSSDERACVFLRVRPRDHRNPVLDLGVVARLDDRGNIVQRPGT